MAVITVECQGRQWQDDFTPLVPRLFTYFSKCFWRDRDYEDKRTDAVHLFMCRFMRMWKPGVTVRIATRFVVWHVKAGRCGLIPKVYRWHRSVRARNNYSHKAMTRWRAKDNPVLHRLIVEEALEQLTDKERSFIRMWLARYTWAEIRSGLATTDYYIKLALDHAYELLNR